MEMETDTPHDQEDPHSQADEGHLQDGADGQGPGAVQDMIEMRAICKMVLADKALALCKMIDRHMWLSLRHFKLGHAIQEIGRMMTRPGNQGVRVRDCSLQKLRFSALCGPN